jgi:hypothetical protein
MKRCIETEGENIDKHPSLGSQGSAGSEGGAHNYGEREVSSSTWPSWRGKVAGVRADVWRASEAQPPAAGT